LFGRVGGDELLGETVGSHESLVGARGEDEAVFPGGLDGSGLAPEQFEDDGCLAFGRPTLDGIGNVFGLAHRMVGVGVSCEAYHRGGSRHLPGASVPAQVDATRLPSPALHSPRKVAGQGFASCPCSGDSAPLLGVQFARDMLQRGLGGRGARSK